MQAITGIQYQNAEDAYAGGRVRAEASLDTSSSPIFLMDEMCDTEIDTAFAMGWNSVAVSETNSKRLTAMSKDPTGAEQTVDALQKLFAKSATFAPGEDPLKLNFK